MWICHIVVVLQWFIFAIIQIVPLDEGYKFENSCLPTQISAAMFPWPSIRRRFKVEVVALDTISPYPCSALIQAKTAQGLHTLWMCIPLSMAPPDQPFIKDEQSFSWTANADQTILVTAMSDGTVRVYQRQVKHFEWKLMQTLGNTGLTHTTQWSSTLFGLGKAATDVVFAFDGHQVLALEWTEGMHIQKLSSRIWRFGAITRLSAHGRHVTASYPSFRQWDGIVDLYTLNPFNRYLELVTSLQCAERGTGFGHGSYVVKDRWIISAPFFPAPVYGSGAVLVFDLEPPHARRQILICPEATGCLHFGAQMSVSPDGEYLAVSTSNRVFKFQYHVRRKRYLHYKTNEVVRNSHSDMLRCVISDSGQVVVYDDISVHWLSNSRNRSLSI